MTIKLDNDRRATTVAFKVAVGQSEWTMHDIKPRNEQLDEVCVQCKISHAMPVSLHDYQNCT